MKKYLGTARKEVQAEKIMVLLVESGMLYLTIYVIISACDCIQRTLAND